MTVVGSESLWLWITATATYIFLLFFRIKCCPIPRPVRFEIITIIVWPFIAILPATLPYALVPYYEVYAPLEDGQCFFASDHLIVYVVSFLEAFLLVYILATYLAVLFQLYTVSKQEEYTFLIQKSHNRTKLKKLSLTLAFSPIMYLLGFVCLVVVRWLQFAEVDLPLDFVAASVNVKIFLGACYSLWVGYSSEVYVQVYRKLRERETLN